MPRILIDNKYEVVRKLREGGFGVIFYGWDLTLDKPVAIKEIAPSLLGHQQYLDMFTDEALNTAKLSHANIVSVYDLRRTPEGRIFIIMEYLDGVDLRTALERCRTDGVPFPVDLAVQVIAEVCKALEYAHTARDRRTGLPLNIIHRDISPSNIMITATGEVKLIDFGVAKARTRVARKTRTGILKGKVSYMSPEQLEGKVIDRRSDIFSLGVVLYETLAGEKLFKGDSDYSVMKEIVAARIDLQPLTLRQIPPRLQAIVQKALDKDLFRRYQSAGEMQIDLTTYQKTAGTILPQVELARWCANYLVGHKVEEKKESVSAVLKRVSEDSEQVIATKEVTLSEQKYDEEEEVLFETQKIAEVTAPPAPVEPKKKMPVAVSQPPLREKTPVPAPRSSGKKPLWPWAVAAILLLALTADFSLGLSPLGKKLYKGRTGLSTFIASVPPGATVFIDGKAIDQPTPAVVSEMKTGKHSVILSFPGYADLHTEVDCRTGQANRFNFAFRGTLEIASEPAGAEVFCNGVKEPQRTPVALSVPIDSVLSVELVYGKSRLKPISFSLLTLANDVGASWQVEKVASDHLRLTGRFTRELVFRSTPPGADLFIDHESKPAGNTWSAPLVSVPFGKHTVTARLAGYAPQHIMLEVSEKTTGEYSFSLADQTARRGTSSSQPFTGSKDGKSLSLANLNSKVVVTVQDEQKKPLSGAQLVALNLDSKERRPLGKTDSQGALACDLPDGRWKVSIFLVSYQTESKEFRVRSGSQEKLQFVLRKLEPERP